MQAQTIKILLADDHMVVRKGITLVLDNANEFTVVGEAENGQKALSLAADLRPDIVLMDIQMQGLNGIEATRAIASIDHPIKIIGLSTFAERDTVASMIEAGASGYLLKDVSADQITETIRRVHQGEILFPDLSVDTTNAMQDMPPQKLMLGSQQKRVLALMTKGFTNPEIAENMGISTPTARYHVSAILKKLEASKRSEAVASAIRLGLVDYSQL